MGGQKSQEYASLVEPLQPTQFLRLEDRGEYQLWEDRISTRRFMVFTVNPREALSEHNLQIYHFRKLNRAYLVGVQGIYREEETLCSHQQRTLLMLEHLPHTLADFPCALAPRDALVILQAAFAGYRILSYIFGPLLASPDTVFFTEAGVPKIWSNHRLDINEPSKETLGEDQRERQLFQTLTISEKKALSMKRILAVVTSALRNPLPSELVNRLSLAKSYEEGEEALEFYCRNAGIELQDWINIKPVPLHKPPLIGSQPFLEKVSSANPNQENAFNRTLSIRNENIAHFQKIQYQQKVKAPLPIPVPLPEPTQQVRSFCIKIPSIRNSIQHQNITPHQVITETIIKSAEAVHTSNHIQQPNAPQNKRVSVDAHPQIERHVEEMRIASSQQVQSSQSSPSRQEHETNPEQQDYQMMVHDISQPSRTVQMEEAESHHVATSDEFQKQEAQIELWEQSVPPVMNKYSKQSSDNYRSEQRDKVLISQQPQQDIQGFTSEQQLQRYIRNKYSEYFSSDEPKLNHHHTSSLDRQLFEKKVVFAQPITEKPSEEDLTAHRLPTGKFGTRSEDQEDKKCTFGNIEIQQNTEERPRKRNNVDNSLDQRYSKYVLNRVPKPRQPSRAPSESLEEGFRKLLNR